MKSDTHIPVPKSEQDHLRELIDALSQAQARARSLSLAPNQGARTSFGLALKTAVIQAQSLSYYRNQRSWGQIAALLDECGKHIIRRADWPRIADMLAELTNKARNLANRRIN